MAYNRLVFVFHVMMFVSLSVLLVSLVPTRASNESHKKAGGNGLFVGKSMEFLGLLLSAILLMISLLLLIIVATCLRGGRTGTVGYAIVTLRYRRGRRATGTFVARFRQTANANTRAQGREVVYLTIVRGQSAEALEPYRLIHVIIEVFPFPSNYGNVNNV